MCSTSSRSRRCAIVLALISPAFLGANFKCVAVSNPSGTTARIEELEPRAPRVGDVVQARGSGSGPPPLQYAWDFGDGTPLSPGSQAAHIYESPGTYRVTLTVHDALGRLSRDASQLTVSARLLVPSPHAILMTDAVAAQPVSFRALSIAADANAAHYAWNFSDGQWFVGPQPVVTFPTAGTYLASVTVANDVGLSAVHQMTFEVMDATSTTSMTSRPQSIVVIGFTETEF